MSNPQPNDRAVTILKYLLSTLGIAFLLFVCFLIFSMRGAIWGIPFDAKIKPVLLSENSFHVDFDIPCNGFEAREIGFIIDPPIKIDRLSDADLVMGGDISLIIKQGEIEVKEKVILTGQSTYIDGSKGIWMQLVFRYPPLEGFFCSDQLISIDARNISFNLNKHKVTVYVSRDRRK